MDSSLIRLSAYLKNILDVNINPVLWEGVNRLPEILQEYTFHEINLFDVPCLIMENAKTYKPTPAVIRKHIEKVKSIWPGEVIFLQESITAPARKQLIEQKVPFIIPASQMFLPMLGVDLREHFRNVGKKIKTFSPASQALLIYILHNNKTESFFPSDLADRIGYSIMTITRAFNELESADIGFNRFSGRERKLSFDAKPVDLWARALPYLKTPVKKRFQAEISDVNIVDVHVAGLSGLSQYMATLNSSRNVIALTEAKWKGLMEGGQVTDDSDKTNGSCDVEIWSYDPGRISKNRVVDRLSLYLSLKDTKDQRIKPAIENLIKSMRW